MPACAFRRFVAVTLTAAAAVLGPGIPGTAIGPSTAFAAPAARDPVLWFWEWTDGSTARMRDLAEGRYATWARLPGLVVASAPARAGEKVTLEVRHEGRWIVEDVAATGSDGRARLHVNPYCPDGDWCATSADYRLVVADVHAPIRVRFTPRTSSP